MADEMSPSQQAAAWHGMATNTARSQDERLRLALKALDLYEAEVERLYEILDSLGYMPVTSDFGGSG
jgi:predicted ArsR family transcriptional regulator